MPLLIKNRKMTKRVLKDCLPLVDWIVEDVFGEREVYRYGKLEFSGRVYMVRKIEKWRNPTPETTTVSVVLWKNRSTLLKEASRTTRCYL